MTNDNGIFISILSDYGFKATFGNEADTIFLRKALQAQLAHFIDARTALPRGGAAFL